MINILDKVTCCGCTACASICKSHAITMKPDGLGFLYPVVEKQLCTDCGLCEKVCSFHIQKLISSESVDAVKQVYAVRHKDINEIKSSRSGAAFIALSDWILDRKGVVFGAAFDEHFGVIHQMAATCSDRNKFKGSKYVQSNLIGVFQQVKDFLKQDRLVMFVGTPCQTAGLRSFLGKHILSNLYLVDMVCHGVPAPYIWRDYLAYVKSKAKSPILNVNFRDKSKLGWAAHQESFQLKNKKIYRDTYSILFNKCIMLRPSCGQCPYANLLRPSDLTIGDFWNWERVDDKFNADNQGVSLLLVNSDKGRLIFEHIKTKVHFIQTDVAHCLQPNLEYPTVLNPLSAKFEHDYLTHGFYYVGKKYADLGMKNSILKFLIRIKYRLYRR